MGGASKFFGGSGGGNAPQLNGGNMQPSDLPPTSSSGVLGTVPNTAIGTGSTDPGGPSAMDRAKAGMSALFGNMAKQGQQPQQSGYVTQRGPELNLQMPQISNNPNIPQLYYPVMPSTPGSMMR